MTDCTLTLLSEANGQKTYVCRKCKRRHESKYPPELIHRNCTVDSMPTMRQKYANYIAARKAWKEAGKPRRTEGQIKEIYEICKSCPKLRKDVCTHASCGCHISPNPKAFFNKLAWATEKCPLGKWQ